MPVTPDAMLSVEPGSARRLMADIVAESYPADRPIFVTPEGRSWTGAQMREEILQGTEVGLSYAATALRVVRDLLSRQAVRYEASLAAESEAGPKPGF